MTIGEARAGGGRGPGLAVVVLALTAALAVLRGQPPRPKPADAPAGEFSAGRARDVLRALVGDAVPHPLGSEAGARVRARIVAELERLGYEAEVQEAFTCNAYGACGTVKNVLARLQGRKPSHAVLLAAHYDSVPAGPGAADDGMGVAALLEIARATKAEAPPRNPVLFLFDEGEEAGLLGAEAFVRGHPAAATVAAVVNLEARGTSGASLLFEMSRGNLWLVRLAASALARPVTSSIYYTIYERLPNDTDLTVFKREGIAGVNFACIGDVGRYHTPLDRFENASAATLQHHGDNALAMARALSSADLTNTRETETDAVFFDFLGFVIVSWPAPSSPGLSLLALLLLVTAAAALVRRGELLRRHLAWGFLAWLLVAGAPLAAGGALYWALSSAGAFPTPFVARPLPAILAFWSLALALGATVASWLGARASFAGLWAGTWGAWGLVALALSSSVPGIGYVFLVPALVAGAAALPWAFGSGRSAVGREIAILLPASVAGVLVFPLAWRLYDAIGAPILPLVALAIGLITSASGPLLAQARAGRRAFLPALAGIVALACALSSLLVPHFTPESPERVNILFHQDGDGGGARWLVHAGSGSLPPAMQEIAPFGAEPVQPFPWSRPASTFAAPAAPVSVAAPELLVLDTKKEGTRRRVRAVVRSPRGAPEMTLRLPDDGIEEVWVGRHKVPELSGKARRHPSPWRAYTCATLPREGVEVEIVFSSSSPVEAFLLDSSPGLPSGGGVLQRARPAEAAPSGEGDVSIVSRRVLF